jgi:3-oxoacyl-[acyl-carrier-protein] synthase II
MKLNQTVVVGLGAINNIGRGIEEYWDSLCAGKTNVGTIDLYDVDVKRKRIFANGKNSDKIAVKTKVTYGAQIRDFDFVSEYTKLTGVNPDLSEVKDRMERVHELTVISALYAVQDMGIDFKALCEDDNNIGAIISSGMGGIGTYEQITADKIYKGKWAGPFFLSKVIPDTPSYYGTKQFALDGPSFGAVSACTSAGNGLADALLRIMVGWNRMILAGGVEAPVTPSAFNAFSSLGALAIRDEPMKASRPFDKDRNGFVLGEAGGIIALCELQYAKELGLEDKIYAEVLGIGESSDAYHLTRPREDYRGYVLAMKRALNNSGLKPENIDYISAHGTSTFWNDMLESKAIGEVFGKHAKKLAVSSQKSMTGHCLGASPALEIIACSKIVREGIITPTINFENRDPECNLDYVTEGKREKKVKYAMSNSFGLGGHNVSVILGKYEG